MNKYKNIIHYSIINDSRLWSKRIKKTKTIINLILKNPKYYINNKCNCYNISFLLTDNDRIKKINKIYKNNPNPTDVLTFTNYQKISKHQINRFCGIVRSGNIINNDSKKLKINFYDHLTHIIVHALLHTNEFDHNTDKEYRKMKQLEIYILKKLNINNPYN